MLRKMDDGGWLEDGQPPVGGIQFAIDPVTLHTVFDVPDDFEVDDATVKDGKVYVTFRRR